MESEAEEIRRKKEEQLSKQLGEKQRQDEAEAQLGALMRNLLSEEARARLGNVKLVNQELYFNAVQAILYLQKAGQLRGRLGEQQLKQLLEKLTEKREIKIRRK
jgi:programmed cell death protein 5